MNIIEWTSDANFSFDPNFPEGPIPNHRKQHYKPTARGQYLGRQRTFLEKCIQHFHYQGHHWTACLDPDEYVAIENEGAGANTFYNLTGRDDLRQQGSVMDYIDKARARGNLSNSNCFSVPRLTFGAMETKRATDKSLVSHRLKKLDLYRLDTFRWRQHFNSSHDKINGLAKPLVDVSSLAEFMPFQVRNPHRLHTQVCGSPFPAWTRGKFGFRANHYLGSWEAYSYRHSDPRKGGEKSREAWEYRAGANDKFDDLSYKWLDGFIDSVGLEVAEFLLKDTGIPRGYRNKNHTDWTMDITRYEIATRLNHHAKLLAHTEQKKREEELRKQSKNPLRRWGLIK
uniref:Glycosyltransferase family 92 protein n=1 Tax=Cyclophora tenuis TaxID=216820 RepID=A0A7S1D599_CYCTE